MAPTRQVAGLTWNHCSPEAADDSCYVKEWRYSAHWDGGELRAKRTPGSGRWQDGQLLTTRPPESARFTGDETARRIR